MFIQYNENGEDLAKTRHILYKKNNPNKMLQH